jgi:hypothetical protein
MDTTNKMLQPNDRLYQEQYDPNQDFAIFGISDKTKGGVQCLQDKVNKADSSSSEDES